MNDKRSPHFYLAIFWLLISIVTLCSGATPQRPYYSETPNPRHIANNDRLTAEYFNNQLNVIYNWAQRTHTELDNLLHNGIGVASLTVGILNCTNKIINPEWDNLLHNGVGVASITVGLVKTNDLEISNKIDVPAIEFSGRSQPTPPVNNGMLYFDSDLQRFRVYQENAWRDLSSNIVIASDSLTNPLVIQGYISASNIYATNSATINQNLTVKQNINSSGTAYLKNLNVTDNSTINKNLTVKGKLNASGPATLESLKVNKTLKVPVTASTTLGVGSVYYDTTENKLKILNNSNQWKTVSVDVDSSISSTSTNPVQNKVIHGTLTQLTTTLTNDVDSKIRQVNTNMLASLSAGLNAAEASATSLVNNASSSLNTQFNNAITNYSNTLTNYVDTTKNNILESVLLGYVSSVTQGQTNGTIRVTKNGSTNNVTVLDTNNLTINNRITASETMIQSANVNKDLVIGNNTIYQQNQGKYTYRFNTGNTYYRQHQTNAGMEDGAHFWAPLTVYGKINANGGLVLPLMVSNSTLSNPVNGYMFYNCETNSLCVYYNGNVYSFSGSIQSNSSYEVQTHTTRSYYIQPYIWGAPNTANTGNRRWGKGVLYDSDSGKVAPIRFLCVETDYYLNGNIVRTNLQINSLLPTYFSDDLRSNVLSDESVFLDSYYNSSNGTGFILSFADINTSTIKAKGGLKIASSITKQGGSADVCQDDVTAYTTSDPLTLHVRPVIDGTVNNVLVVTVSGGGQTTNGYSITITDPPNGWATGLLSKNGLAISLPSMVPSDVASPGYIDWDILW